MKNIIFILLLLLSTTIFAANEQYAKYNGGAYYISSISNAGLYRYFYAGSTVAIAKFSGATVVFCGIATLSDSNTLLTTASLSSGQYLAIVAQTSDMYVAACVKESGSSDSNILAFDSEYNVSRSARNQERNMELEEKLLEYINSTLE